MASLAGLLGGLGLFLLGMTMMTDGLKSAAGPSLHCILLQATRTRWHALGSGVMVTALVQSSSAVTVAAIGFVNAGLLSLAPALWVLFGANVGTTMTGWIVALVGLKFKVEALALPLVGLGMLLRMGAEGQRRAGFGSALAGFGLLFLGIATLQQAFGELGGRISLPQGDGLGVLLTQIGVGMFMTVLMQSSSASMTVALTAAQGGLIGLDGAAAVVIGANIGTTVTALLAVIGATSNARRAASAHVAFNLVTGLVALLLLPWLLPVLGQARDALELPPDPATKLALFHTCFNVLGVLLMLPLAAPLTRWLEQRFRAREDDEAKPRHLDANVLPVPTLALDAMAQELARSGRMGRAALRAVLQGEAPGPWLARRDAWQRLDAAIAAFVERLGHTALSGANSHRLANLLLVQRYQQACQELTWAEAPLVVPADSLCVPLHEAWAARSVALLNACDGDSIDWTAEDVEQDYQALKAELLAAGAGARMNLSAMAESLRRISGLRRALQQALQAHAQWAAVMSPA
ncbi:MAG: Na/Pi cotransporter family protein [Burkholderiales bacterium]